MLFQVPDRVGIHFDGCALAGIQPPLDILYHFLVCRSIVDEIMSLSLVDISIMFISASHGLVVLIQQQAILGIYDVPVIGIVKLAHLNQQGHVV